MSKVKILNNIVSNNSDSNTDVFYSNFGIAVRSTGTNLYYNISNNLDYNISNNTIYGQYNIGIYSDGNGCISNNKIDLIQATNGMVTVGVNCLIENNLINGNITGGIGSAPSSSILSSAQSLSIINNNIFATCENSISCLTQSESISIIGNNIRSFTSTGLLFNGGIVQSNLISRSSSQNILSFISAHYPSESIRTLIVDNIFSHATVDIDGNDAKLVKPALDYWVVERNLPNYSIEASSIKQAVISLLPSTSISTPSTPSEPSSSLSSKIIKDNNHVFWYNFEDADTPFKSTSNHSSIVGSDLIINGNNYMPRNYFFYDNSIESSDAHPSSRLLLNSQRNLSNPVKTYLVSADAPVVTPYFHLEDSQSMVHQPITVEVTIKMSKEMNHDATVVSIANVWANGPDAPERFTIGVRKNCQQVFFGYGARNNYNYSYSKDINVSCFDNTHLMLVIKPNPYIASSNLVNVLFYVNGSLSYQDDTPGYNFYINNHFPDGRLDNMKIYIGKSDDTLGTHSVFSGGVANLRISNIVRGKNYALSAAQEAKSLPSDTILTI